MNYDYPGHGAADPWCDVVAGDTSGSFADVIWDYCMDDFFRIESEGEGGGAAVAATPPGSPAVPEVRFHPPSEEEMAAWLHAIVKGEEPAFNDDEQTDDGGGRDVPAAKGLTTTTTMDKKEKLPMAEEEGMGTKQHEMRKTPLVRSPTRRSHSHHGEAHNLTEKRRRNKINERFRTLHQLVPGCDDKCNQVSTLDRTIQYMKSLQHQVQAMMCVGGTARPPAPQHDPQGAAVAMPMMLAAPVVLAGAPTMVPFRSMLQLPHYPAAAVTPAVMMPAGSAPLYPAPAAAAPVTPAAGAARLIGSHRQATSSSRSLRQKQGK